MSGATTWLTSLDLMLSAASFLSGFLCACLVIAWKRPPGAPRPRHGRSGDPGLGDDHCGVTYGAIVESLQAMKDFHARQASWRSLLASRSRRFEERRSTTLAAVDLICRSVETIRLPTTLAELYDSLIGLPRKAPGAQQADIEWHALAVVKPVAMDRWQGDQRAGCVELSVDGMSFVLEKRTVETSALGFEEYTLFDAQMEMLARVRVTLSDDDKSTAGGIVTACRPGLWVRRIAELRFRMDERRAAVLMRTRCREVNKLRADFGIVDNDAPDGSR